MFNTINPQHATAGCKRMLDTAGVSLVADALGEVNGPIDFAFMQGFLAGLNFPTIPKNADVYGSDIPDYAFNALVNCQEGAYAPGHR